MKKISFSILIGILLFCKMTKAQNIVIDPTTNWQQYISTILGGNCLSISNVTFTAGSEAAGRFSNAQGIGLNSGILITTGKTSNVLDSITNDTGFMNLPGDSDITLLAQGTEFPWISSYDAAVLEFDFVSDVTDSVIIKYVFGSKEYPEYAPPNSNSFSDLFAFWVTDSSGARQNIATLPNGVPVSINNINAITNTEYYIEGNYQTIGYDGYTTVLFARFYAVAGQSYHLKIAIADVGDSNLDSGVFLESMIVGSQTISGTAQQNGAELQQSTIEIFGLNTDSTAANLLATAITDETGGYIFNDIEVGDYVIKVTPNADLYPNLFPEYFNDAYVWSDASIISLPCANFETGLMLAPVLDGTNTIGGNIETGVVGGKMSASTLENVSVWLMNGTDNTPVSLSYTDAEGNYIFENIPNGDYAVKVDITGLNMDSVYTISLTGNNNLLNLDYLVSDKSIFISDVVTKLEKSNTISFKAYPVPFTEVLTILIDDNSIVNAIHLKDMNGKIVWNESNATLLSKSININTGNFAKGVYFLEMIGANGSAIKKVVK
jgi:hypothetical protein